MRIPEKVLRGFRQKNSCCTSQTQMISLSWVFFFILKTDPPSLNINSLLHQHTQHCISVIKVSVCLQLFTIIYDLCYIANSKIAWSVLISHMKKHSSYNKLSLIHVTSLFKVLHVLISHMKNRYTLSHQLEIKNCISVKWGFDTVQSYQHS